jgi:hypothetical protein
MSEVDPDEITYRACKILHQRHGENWQKYASGSAAYAALDRAKMELGAK